MFNTWQDKGQVFWWAITKHVLTYMVTVGQTNKKVIWKAVLDLFQNNLTINCKNHRQMICNYTKKAAGSVCIISLKPISLGWWCLCLKSANDLIYKFYLNLDLTTKWNQMIPLEGINLLFQTPDSIIALLCLHFAWTNKRDLVTAMEIYTALFAPTLLPSDRSD